MIYSLVKECLYYVVLECEDRTIEITKDLIVGEIKETYLYKLQNGKFELDLELSNQTKKRNSNLLSSLFQN